MDVLGLKFLIFLELGFIATRKYTFISAMSGEAVFGIESFGFSLAFELWNLTFFSALASMMLI